VRGAPEKVAAAMAAIEAEVARQDLDFART